MPIAAKESASGEIGIVTVEHCRPKMAEGSMRFVVSAAVTIILLYASSASLGAAESSGDVPSAGASRTIIARVVNEAGVPEADATLNIFTRDFDRQTWKDLGRELRTDSNGAATWEGL